MLKKIMEVPFIVKLIFIAHLMNEISSDIELILTGFIATAVSWRRWIGVRRRFS
jgi:hypothetical protein